MAAQQQVYIPQVQGALPAGTTQYVVQQQPVVYQTQPYTQQQQPQTIIITQPVHVPKITIYQNYRANSARLQGALQLAIGLLSIILTVAGIVTKRTGRTVYENNTFVAAPGIWCAVFVSLLNCFFIVKYALNKHIFFEVYVLHSRFIFFVKSSVHTIPYFIEFPRLMYCLLANSYPRTTILKSPNTRNFRNYTLC